MFDELGRWVELVRWHRSWTRSIYSTCTCVLYFRSRWLGWDSQVAARRMDASCNSHSNSIRLVLIQSIKCALLSLSTNKTGGVSQTVQKELPFSGLKK